MSTSLQRQLSALERERVYLETLLKGDVHWDALCDLDRSAHENLEPQHGIALRRETLLAALSNNRVFQAHQRITDALKLLKALPKTQRITPRQQHRENKTGHDGATSDTPLVNPGTGVRDNEALAKRLAEAMLPGKTATVSRTGTKITALKNDTGPNGTAQSRPSQRSIANGVLGAPLDATNEEQSKDPNLVFPAVSGSGAVVPGILTGPEIKTSSAGLPLGDLKPKPPSPTPEHLREPATKAGNNFEGNSKKLARNETHAENTGVRALRSNDLRQKLSNNIRPVASVRIYPPEQEKKSQRNPERRSPDDLTQIRGVNKNRAAQLLALGVTQFEDIEQWSSADVRTIRAALGLQNQISQQNWIEQAALLSKRKVRETSVDILPARAVHDTVNIQHTEGVNFTSTKHVSSGHSSSKVPDRQSPKGGLVRDSSRTSPSSVDAPSSQPPSGKEPPLTTDGGTLFKSVVDVPEGLMALDGMTKAYVTELQEAGFGTLKELADITFHQLASARPSAGLIENLLSHSWVEQASMLATGSLTYYLKRKRRGDFIAIVHRPKTTATKDDAFAARLASLVAKVQEARAEEVDDTSPPPHSSPQLAPPPPKVESEQQHAQQDTERVDIAEFIKQSRADALEPRIAADEKLNDTRFKRNDNASDVLLPTPVVIPMNQEQDHAPEFRVDVARAWTTSNSKSDTRGPLYSRGEAESASVLREVPLPHGDNVPVGKAPISLADDVANHASSEPQASFDASRHGSTDASEAAGNSTSMPVEQTVANPSHGIPQPESSEVRVESKDEFKDYVSDGLTHAGASESEVVIVQQGPSNPAPRPRDVLFDKDAAPRVTAPYAPMFLEGENEGRIGVGDLPSSPHSDDHLDAEHLAYKIEVQEASVEVVKQSDNASHPRQNSDVAPRDVLHQEKKSLRTGKVGPKLSRFYRALTGE